MSIEAAPPRPIPIHDPDWWTGNVWADLKWLRTHDPVHRVSTPAGDVWAISRHADVMDISRHPLDWPSGRGVLIDDLRRVVAGNESIIYLDPPDHARHRKLVSGWFKPSVVRAFEERVRALAVSLLDDVPSGETFDANEALAIPLPIRVIAEMLGVPSADQDKFRLWSDEVIMEGSSQEVEGSEFAPGVLALYEYFEQHLAERRVTPGHDVLSTLVAAELDGHQLSDFEMLAFCMTLLVAGNETTRNLLGNGLEVLAGNPDEWDRLRAEPELIPLAVEELLRWVTPVLHFARTAAHDSEIAGVPIASGEMVVLLYASANRDEAVFGPTADHLDLGRDPNPHVAFGFGEHFCLGAQLARLEARVFLEELAARAATLEVTGPVERRRSNLMRGLSALPMRFGR
ncbi:MAG TPA: cytochrome P450 [Acidimicrobiales bacterium]